MDAQGKRFHVVMFPWLAPGHIIPFSELAKGLAHRGIQISFVSSPRNIERLPRIPSSLSPLIDLVKLPLPRVDELPDNAEATMDVPMGKGDYLHKAFDGLEAPFTNFLMNVNSFPDWIIYDYSSYWLPPLANKLGIRCALFGVSSAASLAFFGPPSVLMGHQPWEMHSVDDSIIMPRWLPLNSQLFMRRYEGQRMANVVAEKATEVSRSYRFGAAIQGSDAVLVRTCKEFEPDMLRLIEEEIYQNKPPIIPIGPLLPAVEERVSANEAEKWAEMSDWLSKHNQGSVVYVAAIGTTEAALKQEEINELALGLELSELPFFWVLRKPVMRQDQNGKSKKFDEYLPDGFKERTCGRGFVCEGWAPQAALLAHPSVGGFLTHCGWGSIVEGLMFGRALIPFPCMWEQGITARLMVKEKVGVEIPRRQDADGLFTRESVAKTVRLVMVEEEGAPIRTKAREMKEIFGNKGLHDEYLDNLVQYLKAHCKKRPESDE